MDQVVGAGVEVGVLEDTLLLGLVGILGEGSVFHSEAVSHGVGGTEFD